MPDAEFPDWIDETGIGVVGVLTKNDGERLNVELTDFDEDAHALIMRLISSGDSRTRSYPPDLVIPISSIASFKATPRKEQSWPHSDPCRGGPIFSAHFALMTTVFLCLVPGSLALFILFLTKQPYRLQELSALPYSLFVLFLTFAATRGMPRFLFTCPAVKPELPRLLLRHSGFLIALFVLQTGLLAVRPELPAWWSTQDQKGGTPFELAVLVLSVGLGYFQVLMNRKILKEAHEEFWP